MERDEELIAISRKRLAEKCKRIASSLNYNKKKNPSGLNLFRKYTRMDKVQKGLYRRLREKELRESKNTSFVSYSKTQKKPAFPPNKEASKSELSLKREKCSSTGFDESKLKESIEKVKSSYEHAQNVSSRKRKIFQPIDGFISGAQLKNDFTQSRFDQLPLKQRPSISKPTTLSINSNSNKKIVENDRKTFKVTSVKNKVEPAVIAEREVLTSQRRYVACKGSARSKDYIVPYPHHIDRTDPLGLNDNPNVRRMACMKYNPSHLRTAAVQPGMEHRYAPVVLKGRFVDDANNNMSNVALPSFKKRSSD